MELLLNYKNDRIDIDQVHLKRVFFNTFWCQKQQNCSVNVINFQLKNNLQNFLINFCCAAYGGLILLLII